MFRSGVFVDANPVIRDMKRSFYRLGHMAPDTSVSLVYGADGGVGFYLRAMAALAGSFRAPDYHSAWRIFVRIVTISARELPATLPPTLGVG